MWEKAEVRIETRLADNDDGRKVDAGNRALILLNKIQWYDRYFFLGKQDPLKF